MARSPWYVRKQKDHSGFPVPGKWSSRDQSIARERAFLRRNRHVPYLFGHTDDVAVAMRKRARDRMHAIAREQQYLKRNPVPFTTARFQYGLNRSKYQKSKTRYPKRPNMRIRTTPVFKRRPVYRKGWTKAVATGKTGDREWDRMFN